MGDSIRFLEPLAGPSDGAFFAVDKPAGLAVYGGGGVLAIVRGELAGRGMGSDIHLVHRLDRETSGVLLFAVGKEALARAHALWVEHVEKTYLAVTRGVPEPLEGTIDRPLLEHRTGKPELLRRALRAAYGPARAGHLLSGRRVLAIPPIPPPGRTIVHPAGRAALTGYRVLGEAEGRALLELRPRQGRMHQIRVHLASLGTPIFGDRFYDERRSPEDPAAFLHAWRLTMQEPDGARRTWEAPLAMWPIMADQVADHTPLC